MKRLIASLGLLTLLAGHSAQAQEWPARQPIKVIVTLSPGSATDVLARIAFEQVSKQIGQAIVIENRAGAGQRIGTATCAQRLYHPYGFAGVGLRLRMACQRSDEDQRHATLAGGPDQGA